MYTQPIVRAFINTKPGDKVSLSTHSETHVVKSIRGFTITIDSEDGDRQHQLH